ncbi:MAG: hypothetical protein ONB05_05810, partial [candidate division KSB1 bacterium]|nr:hypothetical protein [candidate division KSB1 bacterium]
QNDKVFSFYSPQKWLLTYVHDDNKTYMAQTIYMPVYRSSQLYLTQVRYPSARYNECGVYFHPKSNWNCRLSYSRWRGAGDITWLKVLVLVNLPYGIIP